MGDILVIGKHGLQAKLSNVTDESLSVGIGSQERELTALLNEHEHDAAVIMADNGLNEVGRRDRLTKLAQTSDAKLTDVERRHARLLGTVQTERDVIEGRLAQRLDYMPDKSGTGLVPRVAEADRATAAVREREIRDRLLNLDATKRLAVGLTAAASGDVETLRAIKSAPVSFPVLDAASWKQVDDLHVQRHHAADARRLRELADYVGTFNYNINRTRILLTGTPARKTKDAAAA